jgi:NADP-dependent 3-hydroxy acid dehydrogenase YdfG
MVGKKDKSATDQELVWFITGCSTGFGHELAKQTLERGYPTVVTARDIDDIKDLAANTHAFALKLDVTDRNQAEKAVKKAEDKFGRIDVLVNNAGIGYFAAVEESEEDEVRKMFDVNVFGLSRMIHLALPGMRKQRSGCIVNISSLAGICTMPSLGYYNATKFAVEGLSGALEKEVEPLGIKVMVVEPSGFRTDWAGRSADESKNQIKDYAATAGEARKHLRDISGKQAGDPVRAARAIIDAVESGSPPHHLLLGNQAYEGATAKLKELQQEFKAGEKIARGADYPPAEIKLERRTASLYSVDKAVAPKKRRA